MRCETTTEQESMPCATTSAAGFVQQLAVSIIRHGYFWYVTGVIPEVKDPAVIDGKITRVYGINVSKWVRARRKQAGVANIQYLRHERFFVLAATAGEHHFYRDEAASIKDVRTHPIYFRGYSISYRGGHPSVRIANGTYLPLKSYFVNLALHRPAEWFAYEFAHVPFEPFAPIRSQLLAIHRAVNKARSIAGLPLVPSGCFRFKRKVVKPFAMRDAKEAEAEHLDESPGDDVAA